MRWHEQSSGLWLTVIRTVLVADLCVQIQGQVTHMLPAIHVEQWKNASVPDLLRADHSVSNAPKKGSATTEVTSSFSHGSNGRDRM